LIYGNVTQLIYILSNWNFQRINDGMLLFKKYFSLPYTIFRNKGTYFLQRIHPLLDLLSGLDKTGKDNVEGIYAAFINDFVIDAAPIGFPLRKCFL